MPPPRGSAIGRFAGVLERVTPDPFVIAIGLTLVTAGLALAFGEFGERGRVAGLLDAWRGPSGLWAFLGFSMQMCLVLVTGHALAASPPVAAALARLSDLPRSPAAAAATVSLTAMLLGLINWGLGLIAGAILATRVAERFAARGRPVCAPLLAAAGYSGMLVWHGGLSGSAPLTMTRADEATRVLPPEAAALLDGGVPLGETVFGGLNLVTTGGLVGLTAAAFALMARGAPASDGSPVASGPAKPLATDARTLPDRLDRSRLIAGTLAAMLAAGLVQMLRIEGPGRVGLNEINAAMLAAGLITHGSPRSYLAAAEAGARGCAGIILQFPLYGGILGMLAASGLIERFAALMSQAGPGLLPLATAAGAAAVNLFVPSGGGQWGIQGPIALEAGAAAGVEPGVMIMAVAYGDQLTNMLQPFWALPLLAITGRRAREIVGYTAAAMLVAAAWTALCLLLFT